MPRVIYIHSNCERRVVEVLKLRRDDAVGVDVRPVDSNHSDAVSGAGTMESQTTR